MARICMIAYTFYRSDPRVRREAEALAERGDEVDFICVTDAKHGKSGDELNGVKLHNVDVSRYQGSSTFGYLWIYIDFFLRAAFLVSRLYFKRKYDVVHVHTMPDFLVFAAMIPKLFGAKVILDVHDLMPELYSCKFSGSRHFVVQALTWIERLSIAFADRAIAVSIPHRNALLAHGNPPDKFSVVLNVPDPRIFGDNSVSRSTASDGKFRLIYHGTVARRHGLEIALRAVAAVRTSIPDLEFLVIGHGDDMDRIKRLASEMDLSEVVRFHGRVPVDQLPAYLSTADLGVIPLLFDEFTRYMLPLKLMEYAHLGIATIVTRTETIATYFDETMVRFTASGDVNELAAAIMDLYRNPDKRRALAANADRFNRSYNWEAQKQVLFSLVDSITKPAKMKKEEAICQ